MKEAYYFSHDSNAKDDPKCILLIEQLGLEGYGIFWILIEMLRDQPGHKYPLNLIPAIARRFNSTTEKVTVVVKNYNLFVVENEEFFYSESLIERMQIAEEKRIKKSNAGQLGNAVRWGNQRLLAESSQCDGNPIAIKESKVKEKKVKESKVKEKKVKESKKGRDIDEKLIIPLKDFADMRKKIKAPLTENAIDMLLKKLHTLSGGDIKTEIEILNQSTFNCWKSVYELKDNVAAAKQKMPKRDILMEIIMEGENGKNGNSQDYEDHSKPVQKLLQG